MPLRCKSTAANHFPSGLAELAPCLPRGQARMKILGGFLQLQEALRKELIFMLACSKGCCGPISG